MATTDEEAQLLSDGERTGPNKNDEQKITWKRQYYTLPNFRFSVIIKTILFIDAILSLCLWLAGGAEDNDFLHSISHFHILRSTFDLALLTALKLITMALLYSFLEDATMAVIEFPYEIPQAKRKRSLHIAVMALSFLYFAYPVVKGGFILNALLNWDDYTRMNLIWNIMVISMAAFGLLELIMALYGGRAMRNLMVIRVLHRINENNQEVDEEGKVIKTSASLLRLTKLARKEWKFITSGTFFLTLASASQTAAPLLFGKVVDAALHSMHELNRTILILFMIYIAGSLAGMMRSWLFTLAGHKFVARLRKELYNNIIVQEIAFFDTNRTGELTNRLSSDTQVLQNAVTVNISMLVRNLLQIFGSLILMLVLNPSLTGVLLAVVPIVSLGAVQYGRMVMKRQETFQKKLADASTVAEESISSIRTVRSFVGEPKSQNQYGKAIHESYKVGAQLAFLQGSFDGLVGTLAYGAITLVLWYGGKLLFEGHITAGLLTSFLLYTLQVAMCFGILSSLYGDFMKAVGASTRIFELMDRFPSVPTEGGLTPVTSEKIKSVSFENVRFTYPSRPDSEVLQGVTFKMEQGQMIALVGPSGGGKSTIVGLIERFYDPDTGKVLVGDEDVKTLDPSWLRKRISIVSQEPTLFACSIKDNISYGKNASLEEVMDAAKQANAHEFINSFDEGYDTLVGERGVRLSGGQKQRVAIARALIMDPEILLLDEATSALDAESEHLVQEAIDRAMENRTVLVIAHRLSTVRNASKVIVIDKGKIAEEGTHEELLNKEGVYKRLVLRQLTAGAITNLDIFNGTPNNGNSRNESPMPVVTAENKTEENNQTNKDNQSQDNQKTPDSSSVPNESDAVVGNPSINHTGDVDADA